MCTFYKYYNGEKTAPVLTIFIGGNHEASNYLQELPYGGWVAPNIYYLGYAGVINIAGIRIAGISGIYKSNDYMRGHYEVPPYNEYSIRSVYHIRNLEIFRLKQLREPIDIFLSHDWPTGVTEYGNCKQLVKFKPHFQEDIDSGGLGNPHTEILLKHLKPGYWFAAHLHCKFAALIPHSNQKVTKFLALDKCLPNRRFLQILDIPHDTNMEKKIYYDLEWLTILNMTNHLLSIKNVTHYMPGPNGSERFNFTPTKEEKEAVLMKFENDLVVPLNFEQTQPGHNNIVKSLAKSDQRKLNSQTQQLCKRLEIDDPVELIWKHQPPSCNVDDTIDISVSDSFINDSDMIEENDDLPLDNSPINKSSKLILPDPKNPDGLNINDYNQSAITLPTSTQRDCNLPDEDFGRNEENDTPLKKFKRRNADMYSTLE
ncbi:hypothetical protein Trydic_g811 [Trypoxylus dichotomus]